ncbi:U3 small nucleolar RNA-associated protein 20-like [Teratosphaeria destructans]|uniref:U3 small nucleolar RNA-associated protein 20-like n=1 Tax=Teratosphaeria destructans TaxID=418781 RepID=A0A9W7SWG6_9PEZI|nr:U3 small nucleolar RNA-associated protein 20-like [Teratosphaeria destructans]
MAGVGKGHGGKAIKPSKVVKPSVRKRKSTVTTKHHRFETFNDRIARLKIDPIRRRRNVEDHELLTEETATYFGKSIEEWRDLNLSATFTAFLRQASPYADTLPVVLHNEDKMMDLLITYIEKADGLAMEPLLSLMSHFAHDLDVRFEKHFARAVSSITAVAAKHEDPAVVEWSFTCLAWLFKYLSRLLAPDLRPLYDLMAPYLGKEPQKPFIIRFAAESMSFLVRKAGATYARDPDPTPLDKIVKHMLKDCVRIYDHQNRKDDLYKQGIMTLVCDSIKGVQNKLHSSGLAVLQSLLNACYKENNREEGIQVPATVAVGVLTSLIHHTTAETFAPIAGTIAELCESAKGPEPVYLMNDLLFTIVCVRKGTRIADWKPIVAAACNMVCKSARLCDVDIYLPPRALAALAVTLQYATIDAVLPALGILDKSAMQGGGVYEHFLPFCDMFARLGTDRFRRVVLPALQKFLLSDLCPNDVFERMPCLAARGLQSKLSISAGKQQKLMLPLRALVDPSVGTFSFVDVNTALLALPHLKLTNELQQEVGYILVKFVQQACAEPREPSSRAIFSLAACLPRLLDDARHVDELNSMWQAICAFSVHYGSHEQYWKAVLKFLKTCKPSGSEEALEKSLIDAMSMPSHEIRQTALEVSLELYTLQAEPVPDALSTANAIESTRISLETSRAISMNIRRLVTGYEAAPTGSLARRAVPAYCFGLLHLRLAQAWDDAIAVLADVAKSGDGEEAVMNHAQKWLSGTSSDADDSSASSNAVDAESDGFVVASEFECSNLMRMQAIRKQVFDEDEENGYPSPGKQYQAEIKASPVLTATSRNQALKLLGKIPQIAEKRSRMLVPVLLRWAHRSADLPDEDSDSIGQRWSRKDQKAMLAIFAQFNNPKVLYKSSEVYDALLNLCANGDVEIQREALKALLAWKESAITRHQEHLTSLLDEARFREEISVFLQGSDDDDETAVRPEDHDKLMPVLLRLIYGRAVAGGKHVQGSRRKAIFVALSRFGEQVLGMFVEIAMQSVVSDDLQDTQTLEVKAPLRQQVGMLNMVEDMLETIGSDLEPFAPIILRAVLRCTTSASRRLESAGDEHKVEDASLLRTVRSTGIQCLVEIFGTMPDTATEDDAQLIKRQLLTPRMDKFAAENTQSVSGMLKLFGAWAASPKTAQYLNDGDTSVLNPIAKLLRDPNAKNEVRMFILQEIVDKLVQDSIPRSVLAPYVSELVTSIGDLLKQQPVKDVLDASIDTVSQLADRITDAGEAAEVIKVCSELLTRPNRVVSPRSKTGLLRTILPLLDRTAVELGMPLYEAVSGLFSRLSQPESRVLLSQVLAKLCKKDKQLSLAAEICDNLNAQSKSGRLDEPDHERRERGFTAIYENYKEFTVQQWIPVVHNCLFYTRDDDDLVNRSSASQSLERFIDAAANDQVRFRAPISSILLPAIERGMQEQSEMVRAEYLKLLGRIVEKHSDWQAVSDMVPLTVGGDDEASVFTNILHIQQHRRLRALRRLAEEADKINSSNVTKYWLPLLEHFVFDPAEGDAGRTLADQTVQTIGALANCLNWSSFKATFKRYIGYIASKEEYAKTTLRLLGALVDALTSSNQPKEDLQAQRSEIIIKDFLPPLMEYLHSKDESTVDRRMPVAVTIVKLLLLLPEAEVGVRLAAILTDVSHVLRSRSQEARDQTRRTLATILTLLGPAYMGFIVKELRSALQRGYQLHVLSFTVHSLLVNVTEIAQPGDLDHCLSELVSIIMDDTFGITGQEKDAEEYKSGMKEVKSSKSFDTMELLARATPIKQLGVLVRPLRALLSEKLDLKAIKKADELLIRLRKGIDQNPAAENRDMLIFCHELVRQVYTEQNTPAANGQVLDYRVRKFLIQMEAANKNKGKAATTSQLYKLISFALNLVRKVVRRHEDLQTPANMTGFLPMTGDALVQGQEEVKIAAIKLLAAIIRLPMKDLEANAPVYVKEAVAIIKSATSITSDSANAGLELITAVLREKRSVVVKEQDIAHVLKALKADIDEPDRQGIIYKFLRAVIGRKIVITEVYELMDEVGKVMVTNPDRHVRESARGAYVQFVLDYPQGKDRWNKQAAFLVENLRYKHPSGRQSVMEMMHQLLSKLSDEVLAQLAFTFFVALVPVQVSDADQSCRQMAGLLITKLFERADEEQLKSFLRLLGKWIDNNAKSMIQVAALQCWSTYLRARSVPKKQQEGLREKISEMLTSEEVTVGPLLLKAMLETIAVMVEIVPETIFTSKAAAIWENLQQCLTASDAGIQESASKLIGAYFSHLASSSSDTEAGLASLPPRGAEGLELDADGMRKLCRTSLGSLMSTAKDAPEGLVGQTVRNLIFLGRCFIANGMPLKDANDDSEEEDDVQEEEDANVQQKGSTAIAYLLNRLSYILRADTMSTPARTAALQTQALILPHLPSSREIPNLQSLLRPLYTLTDPSIPQPPGDAHAQLVAKAHEFLELLQKRLGSEAFVKALAETRMQARGRREERRVKRKLEAVVEPERVAAEKRRKREGERRRKKVVHAEARGRRRGW